jgi:hypothetical protein
MRKINCAIWAWRKYASLGGTLLIRATEHSRLSFVARYPLWRGLLSPLGVACQWLGGAICALGWILRWGRWPHVLWMCPHCKLHHEFVPDAPKFRRWIPPMLFRGKVQVEE